MDENALRRVPALTRRRLLALSLAAGTSLLLGACGDEDEPPAASSTQASQSGGVSTETSGAATSASPSTGSTARSSAPASSGPLLKAKLGMVTGINSADVYLAKTLGFYKAHGIDAELITFQSAPLMRDALISGEIDLTAQAPLHVYLSQAKGVPLRVVANRRNTVDVALVVRSELAETVTDVESLKGHSIAVSAVGGWDWAIACQYLREHGLDPERDVQFVNRGGTSSYSLLSSSQVDAAAANPPDLTTIIADGVGQYLINPAETETHQRYFHSATAMSRAWLVHQRSIDEKPDVVAGVVQAANDTFAYFHSTPVAEVAQVLLPNFDGTTAETLEQAITEDLKIAIPATAVLSRAAYEADQQIFVKAKLIEELIPFEVGTEGRWAGVEE